MFLFIWEEEGEGGNGLDSVQSGNLSAWLGCLLVRNFQLKVVRYKKKTQFLLKMSPFFSHLISPLKAFV